MYIIYNNRTKKLCEIEIRTNYNLTVSDASLADIFLKTPSDDFGTLL